MEYFPFVVVAWILVVGLYGVVTSRHLVHQIICLIVVQSSTYVLLLGVGYVTGAVAPYFYDVPAHTPAVDPGGAGARPDRRGGRSRGDRPAPVLRDPGPQAFRHPGPAGAGLAEGITQKRMDQLLALVVAVPLLAAAAITGAGPLLGSRRRALDAVAIAVAAAVAVMLAVIMARTAGGDQVYWFAGFRPARGVVIGIDFEVGPLSAGLACLAAVLVTAAMTFSWRYFERVATYYHTLMLTFLAGMTGFCLTGDIFDLFVWFELMGVSAYALTAYRPGGTRPDPGRAQLRHHQQRRRLPVAVGHRRDLRPHRRAEHGADRRHHRPSPAGRAGRGGLPADHLGPADQERDRAVPLLAGRCARGRAHPGLRAVLRRDGGTGPVRDRPGVLVDVRPGPGAPGRDLAPVR